MKYLKWLFVSIFVVAIASQLYVANYQGVSKENLLLDISMIAILLRREKIFWFLGILLFAYGSYCLNFFYTKNSSPSNMDFTSAISSVFFCHTTQKDFGGIIIKLIPFIFYPTAFLVFLTKPIQRIYHIIK